MKKLIRPKGWKLCINDKGCSKPSLNEMLHKWTWKVKRAA